MTGIVRSKQSHRMVLPVLVRGVKRCVRTRARTAGPSTTLLRSSGRDDNSVAGFKHLSLRLLRHRRIVIPTGAPKERSGGTCGSFPEFSRRRFKSLFWTGIYETSPAEMDESCPELRRCPWNGKGTGKSRTDGQSVRFSIVVFPERRRHSCHGHLVVVRGECQQVVGAARRFCGSH
jgi:hypothetical protein